MAMVHTIHYAPFKNHTSVEAVVKEIFACILIGILVLMIAGHDGKEETDRRRDVQVIFRRGALCEILAKGRYVINSNNYGYTNYDKEWESYR